MLAWSQPSLNPTTTPTPQPPLRRLQVSAGIRLMPPSLRDQRGRPTLRSRIRRIEELALHFAADAGGGERGRLVVLGSTTHPRFPGKPFNGLLVPRADQFR